MLIFGIGGSNHTRADAEAGAVLPGGGNPAPAVAVTHSAGACPLPAVRPTFGKEPSGRSANGCGLRVDRSAATGRAPRLRRAIASAAGTCQRKLPNIQRSPPPSTKGARNATSANRSAQAITRLARIAVLVQNSKEVGPSSSTASMATITPKTTLANWLSGTVLGSGIMNRANIKTSGD